MPYTAEDLDPFGNWDSLTKFSHVMKEKDRVRVKATGHTGVIQHLGEQNRIYVELDSGDVVSCSPDEIEPEDFPASERPTPTTKPASAAAEKLAGFLANSSGLTKALREDRVSPWDRVHIQGWLDAVKTGRDNPDPFGTEESHAVKMLKLMAEKYQDAADVGDVLHKRASGFTVGQLVREKRPGFVGTCRVGRVTKLQHGIVHVAFDGNVESIQVESSLEPAA